MLAEFTHSFSKDHPNTEVWSDVLFVYSLE